VRPLRVDLTGTTDASGNASIRVKLPVTGEWHDVKFALSTTGPAEWALLVSGTAITYGRGRRVTLGPELIQDGEQVTVTITGGPVLAPIVGSATGRSGDPETITAQWGPQPNTIALDAAIPRQKLYPDGTAIPPDPATPSLTILSGGNATVRFTLPAGTVLLRVLATAGAGVAFGYSLLVLGHQSGEQYYGLVVTPGSVLRVPNPTLPLTIPVEFDWDQQVDVSITYDAAAASGKFFFSALFAPEPPGQAGASQAVNVLPGGVVRPQKYDWFVSSKFNTGQTPSIASPAIVGQVPVLAAYTAFLGTFGAVAVQAYDVTFTANPSAAVVWRDGLGLPAVAGQADRAKQTGLAAEGAAGDAITMAVSGAMPANTFADISMGGYYTTATGG
jgi:hypothetical protein